ncbi:unnamed protein product, partial [Gulo gulo]
VGAPVPAAARVLEPSRAFRRPARGLQSSRGSVPTSTRKAQTGHSHPNMINVMSSLRKTLIAAEKQMGEKQKKKPEARTGQRHRQSRPGPDLAAR